MRLFCRYTALLLAACALAPAVRADRDIVYAARYYFPPHGPRRESHWHLYRIDPDGSGRKQITTGNWDDTAPSWSPDGKRIAFLRNARQAHGEYPWSEDQYLYVCSAVGGNAIRLCRFPEPLFQPTLRGSPDGRTIAVLPDRHADKPAVYLVDVRSRKVTRLPGVTAYLWSPDGKWLYTAYKNAAAYIVPANRSKERKPFTNLDAVTWLGNRAIAGIDGSYRGGIPKIVVMNLDGTAGRPVIPAISAKEVTKDDFVTDLFPAQNSPREFLCVVNRHNSTVGILYQYFLVNADTGASRELAWGQFLSWSPDGKRFCTAPGRNLTAYGRNRNGSERDVWTAPLQIGSRKGGEPRDITPALVWTLGADWRAAH